VVKAVVTLNRFIVEEERRHPEATGEFTSILYDIAFAAKVISRAVNKAGLIDILGATGDENVHGERVQKLDEYANNIIFDALDHGGHLCLMASEESEQPIPIPEQFPKGDYVLLYDPLDGSSNIDATRSPRATCFTGPRRCSSTRPARGCTASRWTTRSAPFSSRIDASRSRTRGSGSTA
jgi:fructose-1,6-bisphosphatase I